MSKFSGAVVLGDLNDFISPSQACVKPVKAPTKTDNGNSTIKIENGNYIEVMEDGREAPLKTAQITLNDCLACSGCVTSAETVLIQMQSQEEVYKVLHSNQRAQQEADLMISKLWWSQFRLNLGPILLPNIIKPFFRWPKN